MPFTDELFNVARPIWDSQLQHPFVRGLADGSLHREKFQRWVLQDYLYLVEFSRVFAWAAAKADNLANMSWYASMLHLTLNTEMDLHRQYAESYGISRQRLEKEVMWPTTRAYTDFLVRTAADGDLADLVAALLPCAWGYVFLAQEMARKPRTPDLPYADWIEQYSSQEFAEAADWLKDEMNRLATGAPEAKRQRLTDLFVLSSRYEAEFWEMCWSGETWPS